MTNKAEIAVAAKISHFKKKADHNKRESLWSFKLIMIATLIGPVFVAFGQTDFYAKLIPAILSLVAAGLTAWVQLRKPQNLWRNYRTAQRRLEVELEKYQFQIDEYSDNKKDRHLIIKANEIYIDVHDKWTELVPSPDKVDFTSSSEGEK
ncbi:DUF4231 domain-containing protein [Providencia hangzhouensis]|uniref:DUF4231 domain-containing protein n=1 Tax=Providencia hangzhouensis TaxID=3031799 RepID=UPI0034DD59F4